MARVFTTTFEYGGELHTAIVSQTNDSVLIKIANDSLQKLLPEEGLSFTTDTGIVQHLSTRAETEKLIQAIITGLETQGTLDNLLPSLREGSTK